MTKFIPFSQKQLLVLNWWCRSSSLQDRKNTYFNECGERLNFSVSCKDFNMVISGTIDHSADVLTRLGKIIENYLPPCTVVKFCSDGLDFDNWDSSPYLFKNYDNFNLSFDILDTLRRTNEQYK